MLDFIGFMAEWISRELVHALAAAPGKELRVFFSGPPGSMLTELFERLLAGKEFLKLDIDGVVTDVPVFILDPCAIDSTELVSARCTASHLVKIRTSVCPVFVALQPPGDTAVLSLATAVRPMWKSWGFADSQQWLDEPLIALAAGSIIEKYVQRNHRDGAMKALRYAVAEAWKADEPYKDHRFTWQVLRTLMDCEVPEGGSADLFVAKLGLVRCAPGDMGSPDHLRVLERLGDVLAGHGIGPAMEALCAAASEEATRDALLALRQHLLPSCVSGDHFAQAPLKYYAPVAANSEAAVPAWWVALDVTQWSGLLDGPDDPVAHNRLKVSCPAPLVPPVRGLHVLRASTAVIDIAVLGAEEISFVRISRASGGKTMEAIATVEVAPGEVVTWSDDAELEHDRFVRYVVDADGHKAASIKFMIMDHYGPGVVVYCRSATKITPFKLNRRARDESGHHCERYECEMRLQGMGSHQVDIFKGCTVALGDKIVGHEVDAEQDGVSERPINVASEWHAVCVLDTDEDCYYDFVATVDSARRTYRIWIGADDRASSGVASEFDRLLSEHRMATKGEIGGSTVEPVNCRAAELQLWAIESGESYRPLVLGTDYLDKWSKPDWLSMPILSGLGLMRDPRPPKDEVLPPAKFLLARAIIQERLRPTPDEQTQPLELIRLAELMEDPVFEGAVADLVGSYVDWLATDYAVASWCDVVAIHRPEPSGAALDPTPHVILLTPLHPVRLAWQCHAQRVLKKALDGHARCPGASTLDPSSFPDCFLLPCRNAAGRTDATTFLSLASTSDYWSVLWNKDAISELGNPVATTMFDVGFGILIEGLSSGFTAQQVARSIDEVRRMSAAKSTLRVAISSDTTGSSACNDGLDTWCTRALGPTCDDWYESGPRMLHIYDRRTELLHPEQAALASLTARTGATVRWFTQAGNQIDHPADLSIVAHLGVSSPAFQVEHLKSAVDPTGLSRLRIRKQFAANGGNFIAESRVGCFPRASDPTGVSGLMLHALDMIESQCGHVFDSYVFAPKMPTLEGALKVAKYCAVSSSTIDASCFFKATDNSFLWDYELPSYSRRAGRNSGYYLLARETSTMRRALKTAARVLDHDQDIGEARVSCLLREISRRGMPTLKRLTAGGSISLGEIGLLVALRLLQAEFQDDIDDTGLVPVLFGEDVLNLLIPADPFKNHYEDLRSAIQYGAGERPDLIVASIRIRHRTPTIIRLTPIEVKARDGTLGGSDRQSALAQASSFSRFLGALQDRASSSEIWAVAWRGLIASWIDYAFRVYGQLEKHMQREQWVEIHGAVLAGIMGGTIEIQIDPTGRVIATDNAASSQAVDVDNDGFKETIVLSHKDAFSVLSQDDCACRGAIRSALGQWRLFPEEPVEAGLAQGGEGGAGAGSGADAGGGDPGAQAVSPDPVRRPPSSPVVPPEVIADPAGISFVVGEAIDAFQLRQVAFGPGNTRLNQLNVGIIGDLGTGKTQLIQSLIYQLRRHPEDNRGQKPRVLIFDYKKDYSKPAFVEATNATVVAPYAIPINMFDIRDSDNKQAAWLERVKFFCDVLDKLYSGIGPVQRIRIKEAIRQSYSNAAAFGQTVPTIYDVFAIYQERHSANIDSPYAIMSDLVDGGYFERDPAKIVPFSEFFEGVKVINLGDVGADDRTKNLLVVVLLNLFYEHMLRVAKRPFIGSDPQYRYVDSMLLVDEADNIMKYEFDVLKKVLLQGREFGVGVLLASQYLSHFKTAHENYLEPLLTWFIHKVPNISVKDLEGIGLAHVDSGIVNRVKSLACHECLYKTHDVAGEFIKAIPFYRLMDDQA